MVALNSQIVTRKQLLMHDIRSMYALYSQYYDACDMDSFEKDMKEKDYVILLTNSCGDIQGFSTLMVLDFVYEEQSMRAIYSGDTIIHHQHWGSQVLLKAWCRIAGLIKREKPDVRLFWFLIVKGYRTYRYLPVFTKIFYPSWRYKTPVHIERIMNYLACSKFGNAYDSETGIICFEKTHGHLKGQWADIPERVSGNKDVAFFLEKNPGYVNGHELVCFTELEEANLKSFACSAFCEAELS